MLQEMEEGARALLNLDPQHTASPMHSILCSWQNRFQLTQVSVYAFIVYILVLALCSVVVSRSKEIQQFVICMC